jgi:L-aspartate oxidase
VQSPQPDGAATRTGPFDLIVVGSGIAGLYAALQAAPRGRVLLVTKGALEESNTRYAQGGIAVAMQDGDSPELHLRDTIAAGDGLCDREAVAILTREAPDCIADLLRRGVPFDREDGSLAWTLEAAHSMPRVLHAGGDATGAALETTLAGAVRASGVTVLENAMLTDLLVDSGRVHGVRLLTADAQPVEVHAPWTLLATGGAGRLYSRTTNPDVATGDGIAAAYRAGADLVDMEFVQFHPTALVLPAAPSFLISEAVRGEGGVLRDAAGRAFMAGYHPDRELAPRDVVARAIHAEMERANAACMYLDITHLEPDLVERRFPSILRVCRAHGLEPLRDHIPVAPAAHYLMGGIRTDAYGRTSLPGLLACGEAACTGVHGANRLASNSLLEGLVFSRRAVGALVFDRVDTQLHIQRAAPDPTGIGSTPVVLKPGGRADLQALMWRHASVVRSAASLDAARDGIAQLTQDGAPVTPTEHEDANLALLATLVVDAASRRQESRGAHFRSDFPDRAGKPVARTVLSLHGARRVPLVPDHAHVS